MTALVMTKALTLASFHQAGGMDIRLDAGQRWLISGGSGSGKTTLLKTLLGLIEPYSGEVLLGGVSLHELEPARLRAIRQTMGVVFSGGGLLPAWTGLDNLMLPLRATRGLGQAQAQTLVLEFATRCAVPHAWLQRAATQLSAEQATLLSLARALLIEPRLLCIDSDLVWGVLSQGSTRLGEQLARHLETGCTLLVCAGAAGIPLAQAPQCGPPTHWAQLTSGSLECFNPPTGWTLEQPHA